MTSRKITVDKSVKNNPQSGQTQDRDIKPKLITTNSVRRKQNKKIHGIIIKFTNDIKLVRNSEYLNE